MKISNNKICILITFIILINSTLINAMPRIDINTSIKTQATTQEKLPCHTDYNIEQSPSTQVKCETDSIICIQICVAFIQASIEFFSTNNKHSYYVSSEYLELSFEPELLYKPPKV